MAKPPVSNTSLYKGKNSSPSIAPTKPYGDADVVSLLNVGTRNGNTVTNGDFSGTLSATNLNIDGVTNLGSYSKCAYSWWRIRTGYKHRW